jgi:3'(2'), 5'-bisphosphate nucleotidase
MDDKLKQLLEVSIQAAFQAGRAIVEVYKTDFTVALKADHSPLTEADTAAHRVIRDCLDKTGLPMLSEEGRDIPYEERRGWRRFWMVDPLDGTKEFVRRNGEFTVNVALIADGRPVLGVIYVPVEDLLYFGARGVGAFKRDAFAASAEMEDLVAGSVRLPVERPQRRPFTVAASRSHVTAPLQAYLTGLEAEHPDMVTVSAGSSLKFCLVAEGAADQYPRLGPTMEWDTAAGQAIVECAGGRVVEYDGGTPLRYNKEDLLNPWFVGLW